VVKAYVESADHPGYMSLDVLRKGLLIHGVDQKFFKTVIDQIHDAQPALTAAEVKMKLHSYALRHWDMAHAPVAAIPPDSKALVASSPSSGPGSAVGPYNAVLHSMCCSFCWSKGFRNTKHLVGGCPYKARAAARAEQASARGAQANVSVAPPVAAVLPPVALSVASTAADSLLVQQFEDMFTVYASAKERQQSAADATGFVAIVGAEVLDRVFYVGEFRCGPPLMYWDNACTYHLVNSLSLLVDVQELDVPFAVGGLGGSIYATHVGRLPFLPFLVQQGYFAAKAPTNLLSLGAVMRAGGSYHGAEGRLVVTSPDGSRLDECPLLDNNLSPVSDELLRGEGRARVAPDLPSSVAVDVAAVSSFPAEFIQLPRDSHISAEQRRRCDRAEAFHWYVCHASDDVMCEAVTNGHFGEFEVEASDIRLNRKLRGACVCCALGKIRDKPMHDSLHVHANAVGECLHMDAVRFICRSKGGNTVGLRVSDEFSGSMHFWPCASLTVPHLLACLINNVCREYAVYGHRVKRIVCDADPSFAPLVPLCTSRMGIVLSLCAPGQHAKRIESRQGHMDDRTRSFLASKPFVVPPELLVYVERWACDIHNSLPNAASRPSTPDLLRLGKRRVVHYKYPDLQFGDVCVVRLGQKKREEIGRLHQQKKQHVEKGELGVVLGFSDSTPGSFDVLLTNGEIVPREVMTRVQVPPFGWKHRTVHMSALVPSRAVPVSVPVKEDGRDWPVLSMPPLESCDLGDVSARSESAVSVDGSDNAIAGRAVDVVSVSLPLVDADSHGAADVLLDSAIVSEVSQEVAGVPLPPSVESVSPLVTLASSLLPVAGPEVAVRSSRRGAAHPPGFWSGSSAHVAVGSRCPGPYSPSVSRPGLRLRATASGAIVHVSDVPALPASSSEWTVVGTRPYVPIPAPVGKGLRLKALASGAIVQEVDVGEARSQAPSGVGHRPSRRKSSSTIIRLPSGVLARQCDVDDHATLDAAIALVAAERAVLAAAAQAVHPPLRGSDGILWQGVVAGVDHAHDLAWWDTTRPDEFSLDAVEAYYAGITISVAYPAAVGGTAALLQPVPTTACKEVPLWQALHKQNYAKLERTTRVEIEKQQRLGCLGSVVYSQLDIDAIRVTEKDILMVDAHVLYKDKADGRETCRIAAKGNLLPVQPGEIYFSDVCHDEHKNFQLAVMQAHAQATGRPLDIRSFDVVGAFLRIKRESPIRMFLRLPKNLPHPSAGKYLEVFGCMYGLRESNRLFNLEADRVVRKAGFKADPSSPRLYSKRDPNDPAALCMVITHVDDFLPLGTAPRFADDLYVALVERFEEVTICVPATSFTGMELKYYPSGALELTQTRYIERVASIVGVAHLPPVAAPCNVDVFKRSVEEADCVSVPVAVYTQLTGYLVHVLRSRDDIRPFVSSLCSRNVAPTMGDYNKALLLLRYVYSTRTCGKVFASSTLELVSHADASFGNLESGHSTEAYFLSIGEGNAPFACVARMQADVSTCPMTAEYVSCANAAKSVMHYHHLLCAHGFISVLPIRMRVDCATARRLAMAPEISRKSLHIHVKHHFLRELVARGELVLELVSSECQRADVLTKYLSPAVFRRKMSILLNRGVLSVS
jgi:hypothetical protein